MNAQAGVAGRDASMGPTQLARAPTRPSQASQMATVGPGGGRGSGGPHGGSRRGMGGQQDGVRVWLSEVESGAIHCRCIRGGPRYSACMHLSAIGLAAECRDPQRLPFWLK